MGRERVTYDGSSCVTLAARALRRLVAGTDQRLRRLAETETLWEQLCVQRWGAACSAEVRRTRCLQNGAFVRAVTAMAPTQLYAGVWRECFTARHAIPARLLSCYDRCEL